MTDLLHKLLLGIVLVESEDLREALPDTLGHCLRVGGCGLVVMAQIGQQNDKLIPPDGLQCHLSLAPL